MAFCGSLWFSVVSVALLLSLALCGYVWISLALSVAPCGSLWLSVALSMALCGFCGSLALSGSLWLSGSLCVSLWRSVALCGSLWLPVSPSVALSGSLWLSAALCGFLSPSVTLCGSLWLSVALCCSLCGSLVLSLAIAFCCSLLFSVVLSLCVSLSLSGSLWLSLALCGSLWLSVAPGRLPESLRKNPGESGRGPRGGDFRKLANAMDETPIWSQTPRTATFDDDPEANTVHSDVLRRLRGENADVSNESGVFKSGVSRRRGIRRRASRRREHRFLNTSRTAVSRERCRFLSFDFAFRVGENAIVATTAHSDVLRRPVAKTLASAIRKEGRKHDRPQTPRTATFS